MASLRMVDSRVGDLDGVLKELRSQKSDRKFLLFLADIDPSTSRSWCPDCVRAEPVIYQKLEAFSGDVTLVRAYVGDRPTWRNPRHPWRTDDRFKLRGVPTLMRLDEDGAIAGRLEDHEAHLERQIDELIR
ncbi:thioredoxin-like protein Clot [Nymphaea colorata]|nr:thioredoxin-like protein Clot [Nymphaea colorata]